MIAVMIVSVFFVFCAATYMIAEAFGWINWKPFQLQAQNNKRPLLINTTAELVNIAMLCPLILTICYFYTCMRNTLSKCTSVEFEPEK
jgi:hypothetical protein